MSVQCTRLLGYWRGDGEQNDGWPDPAALIDTSWPEDERERVAAYLDACPAVRHWRGLSPCRICDRPNGSAERSDGAYLWPEGLAHYVRDHAVTLPDEVISHIEAQLAAASPPMGKVTEIDYEWWAQKALGRLT